MRQKTERHQDAVECTIKDIRRRTRNRYSPEDKIQIVEAGLRGEDSIAELCRQAGIAPRRHWRRHIRLPKVSHTSYGECPMDGSSMSINLGLSKSPRAFSSRYSRPPESDTARWPTLSR